MRTTISINDDLMTLIKKKSYETGKSMKETIDTALRAGLSVSEGKSEKYACPEYSLGSSPRYNLDRSLDLAGSLEDEEIVRKIRLKK